MGWARAGKNPAMPALAPQEIEMSEAWIEGDDTAHEAEVQPDGAPERKPVS